jgi:hypothetical protein
MRYNTTVIKEVDQPTRIKRRFDQAQPPFDRLCATQLLTEQQEDELRALRQRTNPRCQLSDGVAQLGFTHEPTLFSAKQPTLATCQELSFASPQS